MRLVTCSLCAAATTALTLLDACSLTVDGDSSQPSYGAVSLAVASYDDRGSLVSREVRDGDGAELVAPLDRMLYDPIEIDGARAADPARLFAAASARIGGVTLTREAGGVLRASGGSLLAVRSAWREGGTLTVGVDGGRFEIALDGELAPATLDRFLATALVRTVRGEALLADDCRPDCIYDFNPVGWLCGPMRDAIETLFRGDCAGPYSHDEWVAMKEDLHTTGKRDTCYDLWYIPRPLCEWAFDLTADQILANLEPDESGMVCASDFYARCTGAVTP